MSKLIYSLMVSLDGFMEGPDHNLDWPIIDEELHTFANEQERACGATLYGRRMYEVMAGFWPTADADPANPAYIIEFARIWKSIPKFVFSKTLTQVVENCTLVRDDPVEWIAKRKQQPGKDLAIAGATLAAPCIRAGLIDEYHLYIHPVILGSGTPMFPVLKDRIKLELVQTRLFASGAIFLRYQLPLKAGQSE
jgi:dihydrofolate reductase